MAPVNGAEIALYRVAETETQKGLFWKNGGMFWFLKGLKWCPWKAKIALLELFHAFGKEKNWPIFCGRFSPIYAQKQTFSKGLN